MSREALQVRVTQLENRMDDWDKVLLGVEGTVTLILRDQIALGKKVDGLERKVDGLERKVDVGFREVGEMREEFNNRIDKLERLIVTYCAPKNADFKDIQ